MKKQEKDVNSYFHVKENNTITKTLTYMKNKKVQTLLECLMFITKSKNNERKYN